MCNERVKRFEASVEFLSEILEVCRKWEKVEDVRDHALELMEMIDEEIEGIKRHVL